MWSFMAGLAALAALATGSLPARADEPADHNWPAFRGPAARGVAAGKPTATTWDVERGENIRWKTAIPGLGLSSPIIWGERLFVTTAVNADDDAELRVGLYGDIEPSKDNATHRWLVLCLDKNTGRELWRRVAHEGEPKVKRHPKSSHANCTPATDGRRVVAFFGSEGLYCYDLDGELKWKKDFGELDAGYYVVPQAQWEFASSPVIHEDKVIVQCDTQGASFVAALKLEDGAEIWRAAREEVPTWSTPAVHVSDSRAQVICNGYKHIGGYDLATGKPLWNLAGGGDIPVPTPIVAHGLVYITNAHGRMAPIYAIRLDASGDITPGETETRNAGIAWLNRRGGTYMQTPLVIGDQLYCCTDWGVVLVYDAETGAVVKRKRLVENVTMGQMGFTASGVSAGGKIYYTREDGEVHVLSATPEVEPLAVNQLGESAMATPAISDGVLYFRGRRHVIAVAAP